MRCTYFINFVYIQLIIFLLAEIHSEELCYEMNAKSNN